MLLSEYGFFLFIGLALSKVNCLLRFFWDNINHTFSWLSDFAFQWFLMGDMLSWMDNRARIWEAVVLGSVVMIIGESTPYIGNQSRVHYFRVINFPNF